MGYWKKVKYIDQVLGRKCLGHLGLTVALGHNGREIAKGGHRIIIFEVF